MRDYVIVRPTHTSTSTSTLWPKGKAQDQKARTSGQVSTHEAEAKAKEGWKTPLQHLKILIFCLNFK